MVLDWKSPAEAVLEREVFLRRCSNGRPCLEEPDRIHRRATDPNFVVKMRARYSARRTHSAHGVATANALAGNYVIPRQVSVVRLYAAAVINHD